MIHWVKEHPYLSGLLVLFLVVLFLIIRSRSSSAQTVTQAAGGPSDALQAANLQAQVQQQGVQAAADVQSQQTAAALAAHMADVQAQSDATAAQQTVALQSILTGGQTAQYQAATQLAAVNSTNAAQANIADTNAQAGVQVAGINAGAGIQIAGIQADVAKTNIAAQLAGLIDTNKTSIAIGGLSLAGLMDTNKTNVALGGLQLAGLKDTNASAVQINLQNNQTSQLGITTQGATQQLAVSRAFDTEQLGIMTNFSLGSQAQANSYDLAKSNLGSFWTSIMANDRWGSGENQVSALASIMNQPAIGVAAQQGQAQSNVASSSTWSSFWGGLFGAASKVGTAALA